MRLVFASNNAHKLSEVREIMPTGVEVLSLHEIGFEREIEETGTTLEVNSMIKAEAVWTFISEKRKAGIEKIDGVFADDTGLEIDALHGAPGVYTARWAGEPAANRRKALQELANETNRKAQFRTVVTLIRNNGTVQIEGIVRGTIAREERGESGFGYDALFIPDGYDKTFGELPAGVKNNISHRSRALAGLVNILNH